jgi:D-3-phosphoglycerate dehydrogenase / 2-oxoglutarate reductase
MATNKKKVLLTESMSKRGRQLLDARGDIESIGFANTIAEAEFQALLKAEAPVNAVALGGTRFGAKELAAAAEMRVVARIGVGFDAVDVAALTAKKVPLMVAGTANSPSVAEQAMFMMLALAKRGAELHALVQNDKWNSRLQTVPVDLFGKTVLIVGFGRIGTRTAKRCQAMEMQVLVYDPYKARSEIVAAGCEPVAELDEALPRADFVSIHCPKTAETVGMFNAARLARMQRSAYLVNTARGGIIDEAALFEVLSSGRLAGAGLDVFAAEPTPADNPLLRLANVISAPHMAGVTHESLDRMSLETARNILSVFDGAPNRDNVINTEVLG